MKTLIWTLMIITTVGAFAQVPPTTLWTRNYGGSNNDEAFSVVQTTDGGFIFAGSTNSYGTHGIYIVKIASTGDTIWTRTYGSNPPDEARVIRATTDGNYIITGTTGAVGGLWKDFCLLKINNAGDTLWTRIYSGFWSETAYDVRQTFDGGFIIIGTTYHLTNLYKNIFMVKTNSAGDTLWTRSYDRGLYYDFAYSVVQASDGGYYIAGSTYISGAPEADAYLIRTNSSGDTLWTRLYGGSAGEFFTSIEHTSDDSYILAGYTYSFGPGTPDSTNFYLVKINASGDTLWTRAYGGVLHDIAYSVQPTIDGGYIIAGRTDSFGATQSSIWVLKTTGTGDTLWSQTYGLGSGSEAYSIKQNTDHGYIIAGHTIPSGATFYDAFLVRLARDSLMIVQSPNGGESWTINHSYNVQWVGIGFEGGVKIELNRNYPNGNWEILAANTPNDGIQSFAITDPISNHCRIKVSSVQDTPTDISDNDFSIVPSTGGYLALVRIGQPLDPVCTWDAGEVECPQYASQYFYLRNFGNQQITVYQPLEPTSNEFSRTISCPSYFYLNPNQSAPYQLTLTYSPHSDGTHRDTLLIRSTAQNAQNSYVRIPLTGQRISTPVPPEVVITLEGNNARLTWNQVHESINGCPTSPTGYLIFYSGNLAGPYWYHGFTSDTVYLHVRPVQFTSIMFYQVEAYSGPLSNLQTLIVQPRNSAITREEILSRLH
jgi:hypothetical protein